MEGDVIKSFLVGLGFGVDDASLKKFNQSLAEATIKVTALYASVQVMSAAIFKSISSISEDFEQMGYEYRIIAPAINKALVLRQEMLKAYGAAGINITRVIQQSIKFNMSLAKTQFALKAIYISVGAKFFPLLTKQMDVFRSKIYANMPKIQATLEKFVNFIFKAFEATSILGARIWSILERVYDFFIQLDKATNGWSTIILGLVAAWKFLNLAFLATPLGLLIAGFVALLALWDDFKTFKEGGQSLINWGSDATKSIVGVTAAVIAAGVAFGAFKVAVFAWGAVAAVIETVGSAIQFLSAKEIIYNGILAITDGLLVVLEAPIWLIVAAIGAIIAALTLADAKWNIFGGHLSSFFSGIGGKIMDFAGGASNHVAAITGGSAPIGSNISNQQQTNMNVQQQTQINVNGSADAQAVGRQVATQQKDVNFDMARNMKGAVH